MESSRRPAAGLAAFLSTALLLSGCAAELPPDPPGVTEPAPAPTDPPEEPGTGPVQPAGTPGTVTDGLDSPWSMVRLANGSTLISERDTGRIRELTAERQLRTAGTVSGVRHGGEGGLLGLAVQPDDQSWLYVYHTASGDNRIVRYSLQGEAGSLSLGERETVLSGIPRAGNHNGGRLAFGPDGMLYATTGDAGDPGDSQRRGSLAGKILRMTPAGEAPSDNPFDGSLVYTLGHRNPQGLAWDAAGRLWASEFGQNTWDELNLIEAGGNYGWPVVEGRGGDGDHIDPVLQWGTGEASPSGLTHIDGSFFLAALRGQRLWVLTPETPGADAAAGLTATDWFSGDFGRLRDAVPGPDGTLWLLTNNTDGRGSPRDGDDRILEVRLVPLAEG